MYLTPKEALALFGASKGERAKITDTEAAKLYSEQEGIDPPGYSREPLRRERDRHGILPHTPRQPIVEWLLEHTDELAGYLSGSEKFAALAVRVEWSASSLRRAWGNAFGEPPSKSKKRGALPEKDGGT